MKNLIKEYQKIEKRILVLEALTNSIRNKIKKDLIQIGLDAENGEADEDFITQVVDKDYMPRLEKVTPYEALCIVSWFKNIVYDEDNKYEVDITNIPDKLYEVSCDDDEAWEKFFLAAKVAVRAKLGDKALKFKSPDDLLSQYRKITDKILSTNDKTSADPDDYKELTNKTKITNKLIIYDVKDNKDGMIACRNLFNHSWGKNVDVWCLIHGSAKGDVSQGRAWQFWNEYNSIKKRIAFYKYNDGWKVAGFSASKFKGANKKTIVWWDLNDKYSNPNTLVILDKPHGKNELDKIKITNIKDSLYPDIEYWAKLINESVN